MTVVEPAVPADGLELLKLQYLCYQPEAELYDDHTIPPLTQTMDSMRSDIESGVVLVARSGAEIVGSVRGRPKRNACLVGRLMVHPQFRRQGLGTRLMRSLHQEFVSADRFVLFTGAASVDNLRLYDALGYREFMRRRITDRLELVYLEWHPATTPSTVEGAAL